MTVLVAAASKHGATAEIAERIGAELVEQGVDVEVKELDMVGELDRYEAFVLGSGLYLGTWLKEARRFVEMHASELARRPTWLFASGSIVGDPPVDDDPQAVRAGLVEKLMAVTRAREHKVFAGKLDTRRLGLAERASVRLAHAHDGDYRDWQTIDAWAAAIAHELQHSPVGAPSV
jgi:menaquinone-dependent protoporphyrinogen oxidase